jgi:phosphoribosylanthranilate isomerase
MTAVKICGLTNLEDARWAWRCGADLLGFIFVPGTPRHVDVATVASVTRTLTREGCTCQFVGVFAGAPHEVVRQAAQECGLHLIQLHGNEPAEYARALDMPVSLERRVGAPTPWNDEDVGDAWAVLLDSFDPTRLGGTGLRWRWESLAEVTRRPRRLIVAGGLTPENVASAIRLARPWGVDVSSGVEASPGRKDHDKVRRFMKAVRAADVDLQPGEGGVHAP